MKLTVITGIMLTLLSVSMLAVVFSIAPSTISPVEAGGTIYIRADGSVEGTT